MDLYYSEAAIAISEYLNGYGFSIDRSTLDRRTLNCNTLNIRTLDIMTFGRRIPTRVPLRDHDWWDMLSGAAYTLIETRFRKLNIQVHLSSVELDWLERRALSRGATISELTHEEIIIYDIVDMLEYYNYSWPSNPPLGYQVPSSFSL